MLQLIFVLNHVFEKFLVFFLICWCRKNSKCIILTITILNTTIFKESFFCTYFLYALYFYSEKMSLVYVSKKGPM